MKRWMGAESGEGAAREENNVERDFEEGKRARKESINECRFHGSFSDTTLLSTATRGAQSAGRTIDRSLPIYHGVSRAGR